MDRVEVVIETGADAGWRFTCLITSTSGDERSIDLGLSWADYDLWAPGGSIPPRQVAIAVLSLLLEHAGKDLPDRLDASRVRRLVPGADDLLPGLARKSTP